MTGAKIRDCCRWLVFRNHRQSLPADVVEDVFLLADELHRRRMGVRLFDIDTFSLEGSEVSFDKSDLYRNDCVGGLTSDEKRSLAYAMNRIMP